MNWLQSITREIIGLFVDDGAFAASILVWLTLTIAVLPRIAPAAHWTGPILFLGLAAILIESALRYTRRNRK